MIDARRAGRPALQLDFRVQPQDVDSVGRTHQLLDREMRAQCIGELIFEPGARKSLSEAKAVLGHHIGTTRMARDPAQGDAQPRARPREPAHRQRIRPTDLQPCRR